MVATNDDILKELQKMTQLLKGFYGKETDAENQINKKAE